MKNTISNILPKIVPRKKRDVGDLVFYGLTFFASLSIVLFIIGTLIVLLQESWPAIERFGVFKFLVSTDWNPVKGLFGGATTIFGTLATTVLALLFAVPTAIGIAIFVSETAPNYLRAPIGIAIELLAAIPSIIYGMWGLFTLAPLMANYIEPALQATFGEIPLIGWLFQGTLLGIDLFTASIILGIMIIPFTASTARDAFALTPELVKESAYAIGATKWEVIKNIILPHAKLGVFGGIVLSLGRALGETMAVAFVIGNNHKIPGSLFDSASTITVSLANEFTEADSDLYLSSLYYLALLLFVLSFIILATSKFILLRAKQRHP